MEINVGLVLLSSVIGYLLGGIGVGVFIAKLYGGPDLEHTGSGNTGTTNVLRTLGWWASLLTLLGDCLKGALAALIGRWLAGDPGMLAGALCSVLGHDFPALRRFKGGKGIATSFGATWVVCWPVAPLLLAFMLPPVILTHIMSAGTLLATVAFPFLHAWLAPRGPYYVLYIVYGVLVAMLSLICHRGNLKKLFRGEENRLDFARISKLTQKYNPFGKKK